MTSTVLRRPALAALAALLVACSDDAGTEAIDPEGDAATSDAAALDGARDSASDTGRDATAVDSTALDSAGLDAAALDSTTLDSAVLDAGDGGADTLDSAFDSSSLDAAVDGSSDASPTDTAIADTAIADTRDAAPADTADAAVADTADASPADPCSPLPSGLTTWTKTDSASVGTPDTYFFDVNPGDPFCATITGGGGGTWSINASNGTSSGVYCSGSPKCSIIVPASTPTLLVTAITTDIGGYTLTVRYRPR
ncbi:MAG: hypothetical protein ABI175_29710 [Polyangiales bacterium]